MAGEQTVSSIVIQESAAQTADVVGREYRNDQYKSAQFIVEQTAQGSTLAFVTVKVQGRIPGSTSWFTVGTITPATSAAFTKEFIVTPGYSTANDSTGAGTLRPAPAPWGVNAFLPAIWRVSSTNSGTVSVTYSIAANLYS